MKKVLAMLIVAMMILSAFAAIAESKGTLKMGTNAQFPPYEFYEDDPDVVIGIDAEIAQAVCDKLGYDLEIVDAEFDSLIPSVDSGKFDFAAAGMTVTDERKEIVQFTDSYATGIQVVIVPADSEYTSIDDIVEALGSVRIGVQRATTGDIYCAGDYGDDAVQRFPSGGAAVAALKAGKVDCVVIDNEPAKNFVAQNEGLKILDAAYTEEDYAMAFAYDSEIFEEFNAALNELIEDGTVAAIIEKYIPTEDAE